MQMGLGEKWITALLEVGSMIIEKDERQISRQGSTQGKGIPIAIGLEIKRGQISWVLATSGG